MARKRKKRRRGFWAWLMGHEPGQEAQPHQPPAGEGPAAGASPEQAPTATAETQAAAGRPCPICGGTEFRWGWLESGLYGIGKGPPTDEQPRYVRQKTRFGNFLGVRARVCQNCSQVELFAWEEQQQ